MSKAHRLFVGNLPENIIDQELKNEFASYGRVKDVEVKHKRNADDEITNTFAFIQIDIDGQALRQCLAEFKAEKFRGRFLTVTVARENFLDKLKREREEAAKNGGGATTAATTAPTELVATRPPLPTLPTIARKPAGEASSSESSSSEDEEEPAAAPVKKLVRQAAAAKPAYPDQELDEDGNLLLRKRSKAFLDNGRIRIDAASSGTGGAIHVIERHRKETKRALEDDKSREADKKRLESLGKMKDTYNQQRLAIKNALSTGLDSAGAGQRSNKIVFDAEPTEAGKKGKSTAAKSAQSKAAGKPLFDDDEGADEDYSNDFRIKEQYQGERGAQLLKLQSRFKNDKRFDMDAKFLEEGEEGEAYDQEAPEASAQPAGSDERQWQYDILESVMGKRIQAGPAPTGADAKRNQMPQQTMLRYDPTKQDHSKYLAAGAGKRKADAGQPEGKAKKAKRGKTAEGDGDEDEENRGEERAECEVSKEQFYKVNTNLNSLTGGGGGFSLLSMFGTATEPSNTAGNNNKAYRETLLTASSAQKQIEDMSNPFKYDTSDDEQEAPKKKAAAADTKKPAAAAGKVAPKKGTTAVWHETFFILQADDDRMKDGLAFFMPVAGELNEVDHENRQKEMRNILKKKVKRSIKSALPHGAKPNKRFRKFVRHL